MSPLFALALLSLALFGAACGGADWDSPPRDYEEYHRDRVSFRVFGADSVTSPIGAFQNRCDGRRVAVKFRTLNGDPLRVYVAPAFVESRVIESALLFTPGTPAVGRFEASGLADEYLVMTAPRGEVRMDTACETVFFSADPSLGRMPGDVIMDVAYFGPIP